MARKIELKPIVIKILIIIGVLILVLLATCITMETARSRKAAADALSAQQKIEAAYAANVSQKTDAYALTKAGLRQLDINLPSFALISLHRATAINQNYRDAWLALGVAQLKTNDIKTALTSFQTAEKLDPICAKTYELLKIAYTTLDDTISAQKAGEKFEFLSKNP